MNYKIAFISQAGNVGKTALATALACDAIKNKLSTAIMDLDIEHRSATQWAKQRAALGIKPAIPVKSLDTASAALNQIKGEGLQIIDCPSRATEATTIIGANVDLLVIPVPPGKKDADLQLTAIKRLNDQGIPVQRCLMVMTRQESDAETRRIRRYIQGAKVNGQSVRTLPQILPEKLSYRAAIDDGYTILETPYKSLNTTAQKVVRAIMEDLIA